MKKLLLTLFVVVQAFLVQAQVYVGVSDTIQLPVNKVQTECMIPGIFFKHYLSDKEDYTTLNILNNFDEKVDFNKLENVVIEYSDNTSDTSKISFVQETEHFCIEFRLNNENIYRKTILQIKINGKESNKLIYSIKNGRSAYLLEEIREQVSKAKSDAQKVKKKNKNRFLTEKFGVGITSGITYIAKEGVLGFSYGAYLSLFNIYADFRIMPTMSQIVEKTETKRKISQFNAGYRINIYKGFGITPLIGFTQYSCQTITDNEKTPPVDYNKKYINYGIMVDHIYFNPARTFGIKTGVVVQRHNFGMTFGAVYNW